MGRKCVGFVEAVGLAAALQAADTIAKSANVRLLGYEYSGYDGHILIKFEGNAGAIKAAAEAAVVAIHKVHTDFDQTTAVNLEKTGLDEAVYDVLVHNKNTVGDPLQIASGKRPQGKIGRQSGLATGSRKAVISENSTMQYVYIMV